jgi:hypothetical protein
VALDTPAINATSATEGAEPVDSIFSRALSSNRLKVICFTPLGANGLSGVGGRIFRIIRVNQYKKEGYITFADFHQALG